MPEENQHLIETEQVSTPDEKRESEAATEEDFINLFDDEPTDSPEDAPVSREEYNRLLKGVKKLASQVGREKKEVQPKEEKPNHNDVVDELFYSVHKEAELVDSDLQVVADKLYDGSKVKAWKNEKWIQDKAKSLSEAKRIEEESKSKISKPSSMTGGKVDFSQIKTTEDYKKLTADQRAEYNRLQKEREQ